MANKFLAFVVAFSLIPLGPLAIDIYLPSVLEMQRVFDATDAEMRLSIPFYVYALGAAQLFGGPVSDRWGRRASAMIGLGAYAVGSLVAVLAVDMFWLYAARVVQGLGASFTMVTAFAWVRDNFEGDEAGKWLSYMGGLTGFVPMIAPVVGGIVAGIWGWQAPFVLMAIAALLVMVATPFALEGRPAKPVGSADTGELSCNLRSLLTSRTFLVYSLATTTTFGGLMSYISVAPEVAMTIGGMAEMPFALALGAIGLLQMLFSFAAPVVVGRIGAKATVLAGLGMTVLSGLGLLLIPETATAAFFWLAALGSAGFSLMIGISTGLTLQPFPHCAGLAASVGGFMRMFGGALIATLASMTGFDGPRILAAASLISLVPFLLILLERRQKLQVSTP